MMRMCCAGVYQMHCPKFIHSILDMESQMNGIAVILLSFSELFWLLIEYPFISKLYF